ncbi:UDP-N-acetylmuramoyl-tripeptide--D-alanyl-D-alanine ligase [Paraliomyxa miuraensis]|uniref:UDP-N-acetylmuramoyl-tripeptide--D-alanyl-D- alanine ligase n=1 Tax=Paraliomyxa miuraensis TaxID=376150 RepID=UPI0022574D3C|nr:UDP-N-acetylmuramoyl-tripeptide--D-alanyl-D-alanine ligase [Paraliomyxa miuraensis]MCX4241273.1 UDP-N-acetylmuramoyl-tripeptide--D-alanyl-D-alanine ligase [Paraliomyxa miuraensis]
MRWSPDSLAAQAEGQLRRRGATEIAGAFIDSRSPRPGALFVPIVAARDGHDFLAHAIAGGAAAILVRRGHPLGSVDADGPGDLTPEITVVEVDDTLAALTRLAARSRDRVEGPVVAITGSNGKTTTRAMVQAVLASAMHPVLCTRGNLNNHLGVPLTLLDEPHEPRAMVVELGMSAPGENDHLAAIVRPSVAIITSIALEHLEFMGTLEAIAAAEAEVVPHVAPDGIVVVPSDEPTLRPHLPASERGPAVLGIGPTEDADVVVLGVALGERTEATLRLRTGDVITVRLRCFGAHNARNAAAALAVGTHLGLPLPPMLQALEAVEPVGDRGRVHHLGPHLLVADCYNANPGSMEAALGSLAAIDRQGPRVAVLGDMLELGPREHELHAEVGRRCAALGLDLVITLGPLGEAIARAAHDAGATAHHVGDDLEAAAVLVREALEGAQPGAVLLKASRGVRLERLLPRLGLEG